MSLSTTRPSAMWPNSSSPSMALNSPSSPSCFISHNTSPTTRAVTGSSTLSTCSVSAASSSFPNGAPASAVCVRRRPSSQRDIVRWASPPSTPTCAANMLPRARTSAPPRSSCSPPSPRRTSSSSRAASPFHCEEGDKNQKQSLCDS